MDATASFEDGSGPTADGERSGPREAPRRRSGGARRATLFPGDGSGAGGEIERRDVGIRIALSLLFVVILGVVEGVMLALVLFELTYSLVTGREAGTAARSLGNDLSTYYYRVLRYLSHNEATPPFPFAPFEAALEATGSAWSEEPGEFEPDSARSRDGNDRESTDD